MQLISTRGGPGGAPPLTILAATSGDTGGAVAHAFHALPGIRAVVLYPLGKVSPRQEARFATLGGNVTAVAVRSAFDDFQRIVHLFGGGGDRGGSIADGPTAHTAVGLLGLRDELRRRPGARGVVLATAHPAKFAETGEPLIGRALPVPEGIAAVMDLPRRSVVIEPEMGGLRGVVADISA